MLTREEMKNYALEICIPLMERKLKRMREGDFALKPDQVGFIPSFLENFCRPFWGIAPILAQGEDICLRYEGQEISVSEYMREGLQKVFASGEGTWAEYKPYFSAYVYENQNITELAGLLVGLWFARNTLWDPLPEEEKVQYAWAVYEMARVAFEHSWPNNHYWFPLLAVTVLKRLGYSFPETEKMLEEGLAFLDKLYLGNGWYADGSFGRFDYYEAWSLHFYPLLWTLIADESFAGYAEHRNSYVERTNAFLDFYTHWFDERGAQVPFGRSLSYRFAASALFPAAVLAGCRMEAPLAGRILAKNIEFFRKHCRCEENGVLPEGYLYKAYGVTEGYTSDGGAYWCCKSFLALLLAQDHPFWQAKKAKLPAEEGTFLVRPAHEQIHMMFASDDGIVTMYNNTAQYYQNQIHSHRFGDMRGWYGKFAYNSAAGFGVSVPDVVSLDNMIGLTTPDLSMTSHRLGFTDLGFDGAFLHSWHVPFFNDPETVVETWMLPRPDFHVRIHKVKLSRPYLVTEGGFSLGRWDDYLPVHRTEKEVSVENREFRSSLTALAQIPVLLDAGSTQSGYHLYAPLAAYPVYRTEEALEPGEYVFAAAFLLCSIQNKERRLPELTFEGDGVRIQDPKSGIDLLWKQPFESQQAYAGKGVSEE